MVSSLTGLEFSYTPPHTRNLDITYGLCFVVIFSGQEIAGFNIYTQFCWKWHNHNHTITVVPCVLWLITSPNPVKADDIYKTNKAQQTIVLLRGILSLKAEI